MKSMIKELLFATIIVSVVMVVINLVSCASAPAPSETTPVVSEESKKAPKKEYGKTEFMEDVGVALEKQGNEEALKLFETKLPKKLANDTDILFVKAAINFGAAKYDEADSICSEVLALDETHADALSLKAQIAKMRGDKAAYKSQIDKILAKDSMDPQANIARADDFYSKKNYGQAKRHYAIALKREPNNIEALDGVGRCEYYLENDDSAKEYFNSILKIDPKNANAYLYLGKIAYANNEYKIASDNAKKALEISPDNYQYNMEYGMYERCLGHFKVAEDCWTKAISIDPSYFLAYAYRAGLYDEQDMFSKAYTDYLKVIELNPKYYYAYESLGVIALHENQWETARKAFMKCADFNKNNISYPLMVTYCYYMEKNDAQAQKYSNDVLRKMPNKNSIEYTMLRLFHDKKGERPVPQKIASLQNGNVKGKMYYYLGLFYDMFGGREFADEYYAKVVTMNSPMFFEYRLAEWRVKDKKTANGK